MDRAHQLLKTASKTIWKERHSHGFSYYCPLCCAPRRIGMHPQPGQPRHYVQIGMTALMVMFALWPWLGVKGLLSFVPLWIVFELIYRAKVRGSLACDLCGFDPILYLVDVKRARATVDAFWKAKLEATESTDINQLEPSAATPPEPSNQPEL